METYRVRFEEHLSDALDTWDADQIGYQFNARALPTQPDPEAERIAGIVRYFDEASTT